MTATTSCAAARSQPVTADEVHALARACLERTGHLFMRTVSCEYDRGVLVLRGRVPSFYLKQLALAKVRGLPGVDEVVNQIDVVGRGLS
jgi:osmotically-inducible protein OsmY